MPKYKHLSLDERCTIKTLLDASASFKEIGRHLGRDCTTISKEIKTHLLFHKSGCFGCTVTALCSDPSCHRKKCYGCPKGHLYCPDYSKTFCNLLSQPPYVCNGCSHRSSCTLEKRIYSPLAAQKEYETVLSQSRCGICISEAEA